jgi:putative transposase
MRLCVSFPGNIRYGCRHAWKKRICVVPTCRDASVKEDELRGNARIDAPGALHHIIGRGIERRKLFLDDVDRDNFVQRLSTILSGTETSCFAWSLLPNHYHLLLRTGNVPIATVMRRLLTGYAVSFNRTHRRYGHVFQNRYKSILCQEEPYLQELVRYIHLNPLRASVVSTLRQLDRYPYSGHSRLMANVKDSWQETDRVLALFGKKAAVARRKYREFVSNGVKAGRKPELTGGGLIRSVGGWRTLKSLGNMGIHFKSDERILGDSDFAEKVLGDAAEEMEHRYRLKAEGYDFDTVVKRVSDIFNMKVQRILTPGRQPDRVTARSVLAYWAVRELGMSVTSVGKQLSLSQSATSRAVERGEEIIAQRGLSLHNETNA